MPCFELYEVPFCLIIIQRVSKFSFLQLIGGHIAPRRRANVTLPNNSYVFGRKGGGGEVMDWGCPEGSAFKKGVRSGGGVVTGTSGEVQAERANLQVWYHSQRHIQKGRDRRELRGKALGCTQ